MFNFSLLRFLSALSILAMLAACTAPVRHADYTAFKQSKPRSILVLPPLNETPDVQATIGVLSQLTFPLAEAGYYVLPVAEADATFKHNGLSAPADIQAVSPAKLRDIFGADAPLYAKVTQYGSVYRVVDSDTVVDVSAKLVDLKTGDLLWQGSARASSKELGMNVSVNAGLISMLAQAAIKQVAHSLSDDSHAVAGLTSQRLLSAGPPNGLLYGPHSPKYGTD